MKRSVPQHVLFLFLDGVGLGRADPSINPFAGHTYPGLERLSIGRPWLEGMEPVTGKHTFFISLDATLGIPGLPQSGTGQATLFTGINCARVAGRHFGPYPHSKTRSVIADHNIFRQLKELPQVAERGVTFANAYPQRFFDFVKERNRWTVTTLCCVEAGVRLSGYEELQAGDALTADLTGEGWRRIGYDPELISAEVAGRRLHGISAKHSFTLFEYYQTDKAGHSLNMDRALHTLETVDACVQGILENFDPEADLLIVTSDHGNIEDMSVKTHTLHAVPFAAYGASSEAFAGMKSIREVTPRIVEMMRGDDTLKQCK